MAPLSSPTSYSPAVVEFPPVAHSLALPISTPRPPLSTPTTGDTHEGFRPKSSSSRSYRDVVNTPPAPPIEVTSAATQTPQHHAAPSTQVLAHNRLGPRSDIHRDNGGPVLGADGREEYLHGRCIS
jgi:hypothetical protein